MKLLPGLALPLLILCSPASSKADELSTMAAELARLRAEVEELSDELERQKGEEKRNLSSGASRLSQVEAEVQRERLRHQQLSQAVTTLKEQVKAAGALEEELKPAIVSAIETIRAPIAEGLPFRVSERLTALDRIKKDVEGGIILPSVGLTRLWSLVEDELRLGRENGLYQQVISLGGEEVLADVARVGMVMLYFSAPDGRMGHAKKGPQGWTFQAYQHPEQIERLGAFFDALKKRIRVGFFDLPNALGQERK